MHFMSPLNWVLQHETNMVEVAHYGLPIVYKFT